MSLLWACYPLCWRGKMVSEAPSNYTGLWGLICFFIVFPFLALHALTCTKCKEQKTKGGEGRYALILWFQDKSPGHGVWTFIHSHVKKKKIYISYFLVQNTKGLDFISQLLPKSASWGYLLQLPTASNQFGVNSFITLFPWHYLTLHIYLQVKCECLMVGL